ncbi:acyl-CoA thioesterase/BAAT N-terminal domain-containing protein [Leifsonia sp. NPDC058248]|uniref:acyl-CoA thioesterase/bile acid-CoA:amino acid N-acyltransferase family protein n=1 Tax=Leifsonia sp. NPDC058248 TaxID=3346402 RepID=UPI0036DCA74E
MTGSALTGSALTGSALTGAALRRAVASIAAVLAVLLALAGCVVAPGSAPTRFVIDQPRSGITDPVAISVVGLQPGQSVVVTASSATTTGPWTARGVYTVPPSGIVALSSARPLIAPYPSPDPAGLLWSMQGPSQSQAQLEDTWAIGDRDIRLKAVQSGREVAATTIHRTGFEHQVSVRFVFAGDLIRGDQNTAPGGTTFDVRIGTFYEPDPSSNAPRAAVLLIDGDDGGGTATFVASQLASAGFATFVVSAFGPEGQIPGSSALSVERMKYGLTWLQRQHDVDSGHIFTFGTWRASQLALWFAAAYPDEIHGAIAASGTTALLCTSAAGSPVLTENGEPVPCEDPQRTIADTAQLPLDRIAGPVLLACGQKDEILANACEWLAAGLTIRRNRPGDVYLSEPGAGHSISTPPLIPVGLQGLSRSGAQATEDARVSFWSHVTALLRRAG